MPRVPEGNVSSITGVMNLLQNKVEYLEIELVASDGRISDQEGT